MRLSAIFIYTILSCAFAHATTFVNRPLGDVIKETPNIVRGRPGDSYSDWDKEHRNIYTYTHFVVTEVFRGNIAETKIILRQPGGSSKDGIEMNVPGVARFNTEEDVVVLISEKNKEDSTYDVPGFTTGKYNVVPGENGEPVLVNSLGGGAIYDPTKDSRTMSYNSKIPLEVFRRIAKGEDIPEASHQQFERSSKPAPHGAFEADHDQHAPPARKSAAPTVAPTIAAETETETRSSTNWVPISFAILALGGALILWRALGNKEGPHQ